jgi:hypothetical protein
MEGGEEKERKEVKGKEVIMGKEGFPGAGPTLLTVQWVAAIKYN